MLFTSSVARQLPDKPFVKPRYSRPGQLILTKERKENIVPHMFSAMAPVKEQLMLKTFVEEAASLASILLFVGTVAVWAQLIPQF
jgi:hypothetical protein